MHVHACAHGSVHTMHVNKTTMDPEAFQCRVEMNGMTQKSLESHSFDRATKYVISEK